MRGRGAFAMGLHLKKTDGILRVGTSCDDLSAACRAFEEQRLSAYESSDPRVSKVYTPFGNDWFF